MKKPGSSKIMPVVLSLLFVLSQTTLALTPNISPEGSGAPAIEADTAVATAFKNYDIDTNGNRVPVEPKAEVSADALQEGAASAATNTAQAAAVLQEGREAATEAAPAPAQNTIKPVVRYVNANELNVRAEPNAESKLVAVIKRGDKASFYETEGDWARIKTWSDQDGYVLAKYLVNSEKEVEKEKAEKTASRSAKSKSASSKPATEEQLTLAQKIVSYSKSLQGVKYVYGGYSTKGFDCSGFTKYVFAKYGISVPRSSADYWSFGTKVARSDLRAGDIVLFDTDGGAADVSHVGIYIGGGNFIHASTYKGRVIIMSLSEYRGKYMGARRVID